MQDFSIHLAKSSEVLELRHQVLRPHQSLIECRYDVDDLSETRHWKASTSDNKTIGVITLFPENLNDQTKSQGYRIRGMAVSPKAQGLGVGVTLLKHAISDKQLDRKGYVWCNARKSAVGFYQKNGFEIYGDSFDIPGIGEHFVAKRPL